MTLFLLLASVFALSWIGTGLVRRYALAKSIIDVPNQRSSHKVPTPRGGGVSLVLVSLFCMLVLIGIGQADTNSLIGIVGGGALVAVIGFWDDHGHIAARWRLLGHGLAAAWGLFWMSGMPPLTVYSLTLDGPFLGTAFGLLFLMWLLNLYNFMDGIDGLAAIEAITVCGGGAVIYWIGGYPQLTFIPLILAAAAAGFLIWNFPPAKIFMGDAGSGYLGLVLGLLALQAGWCETQMFWAWLILLGVFVVDSTFTLSRRLLRGDKVYEAHRSHAYQYASRRYGSHLPITFTILFINLLWLLPLALLTGLGHLPGPVALVISYAPLVFLAYRYKAGAEEERIVTT